VRAVMTAHWMKQMGWDAYALTLDMRTAGTEKGDWAPEVLGLEDAKVVTVDAATLHQRMQAGGVTVVDVDWSRDYLSGHIPGAWYAIRSLLPGVLAKLPAGNTVVITSGDGALARLTAHELRLQTSVDSLALAGGTAAWRQAGLPLEKGATRMATPADDIRLSPRHQSGDVEAAMRAYLTWEIDLVNQMATDDDQRFSVVKA
jgi:rhodanese-related sulfurtransferase